MAARLETEADDLAALIRHVSPDAPAPAPVFGTSSGGIVSLELPARHPETVAFLVAHEPPLGYELGAAEGVRVEAVFESIYATYRARGIVATMEQFVCNGNDTEARVAHDVLALPGREANVHLFFEHEITQDTAHKVSVDGLRALGDSILFVNGETSLPPPPPPPRPSSGTSVPSWSTPPAATWATSRTPRNGP